MQPIHLTKMHFGYWFIAQDSKLWLPNGEIPHGNANEWHLVDLYAQQIGIYNNQPAWFITQDVNAVNSKQFSDFSSIRCLLRETELFLLAGKAIQLNEFYRSHHYCGYCGKTMLKSKIEWCMLCENCHNRYYPQIAPAMIVAIRHDDKILLAKHRKHQQTNCFTVLSGFTEIGETIETTVKREVFEEVGIKIKNIRYVASQPWPFPHSMMLAFLADYDSGELILDHDELAAADWFSYQNLPTLPEYGTIARHLIEETIVLCRNEFN